MRQEVRNIIIKGNNSIIPVKKNWSTIICFLPKTKPEQFGGFLAILKTNTVVVYLGGGSIFFIIIIGVLVIKIGSKSRAYTVSRYPTSGKLLPAS